MDGTFRFGDRKVIPKITAVRELEIAQEVSQSMTALMTITRTKLTTLVLGETNETRNARKLASSTLYVIKKYVITSSTGDRDSGRPIFCRMVIKPKQNCYFRRKMYCAEVLPY